MDPPCGLAVLGDVSGVERRRDMQIRPERPEDITAIHAVIAAAFRGVPHSDQTEPGIVAALRAAGALSASLVATDAERIVGHVALSPVTINGLVGRWYGLGPVSVVPSRQGEGLGQHLVRAGLDRLRALEAEGCVVFGNPAYYGRFGFAHDPALSFAPAPPGYFQRIVLIGDPPRGEVTYHAAFG